MDTVTLDPAATTLINILTVDPANQAQLIALLRDNADGVVRTLDGWVSTSFVAAKDGGHVVIVSQWRGLAEVEAMRSDARMRAYFPRIAALAAFDSIAGDIAYARHA